ncbi:MAG: gas vesicle protein K [Streptosporangiaceae bacterium]
MTGQRMPADERAAAARSARATTALEATESTPPRRLNYDRDSVERGLVTLVLTVVELLRQLMERQALRKAEDGTLEDDKVEEIGQTLLALDEQMSELTEHFGLTRADLNLDLGPLGPLFPQQ